MNYSQNIQASVDYIEEHMIDTIDLTKAVKQSGYSITHFYRIFQALTGESMREYITQRRLSHAAFELATTKRRIIDIAFDHGFHSQEAFTRAFQRLFHTSPARYRRSNESIQIYEKLNVQHQLQINSANLIQPTFMLEKTFLLVGLEQLVKPGQPMIRTLWDELTKRKHEIKDAVSDHSLLGICEYMPDITDEDEFRYMAAIEVNSSPCVPTKMIAKTIPRSKYAVFVHNGPISDLKQAYNRIYGAWLPLSQHELAPMDTIELYSDTALHIYIPIQ